MTQLELEGKVIHITEKHGEDWLLEDLTDDDIYALLAWAYWKDGADWDDMVADMATGQYLPFNTRESAVKALQDIFGY